MALQPTIGRIDPKNDRAKDWLEIYGGLEVPLISPVPHIAEGPFGTDKFYMIDIKRLTPDQIDRAIMFVSKKFNVPIDEAREGVLHGEGLPVLADGVSVSFDARLVL